MKCLNLGSGEFKKPGFVNVDYYSISEPDVRHNLNEFPYPFPDGEFDLIEADHVLEHLQNPFAVMAELYRISASGARIVVHVPHFSRGFTHADHRRGFDITFPYYFDPSFVEGYQRTPLKHIHTRLTWMGQPYLKKKFLPIYIYYLSAFAGKFIDFFANLSPMIASRLWCFWVGGFEEIEFVFSVEK